MRFYTQQHPFSCGLDLHARSLSVCVLSQERDMLLHRNMQAAPEPFLKAIAPSREGLGVAVEGIFTWYWLADLCADEIDRCPSGQEFASYCRLVTCRKDSGGKRLGTSGTKIGNAPLTGAFAEAATLFWRNHPQGQKLWPAWRKRRIQAQP